jgi:hypothetical protein
MNTEELSQQQKEAIIREAAEFARGVAERLLRATTSQPIAEHPELVACPIVALVSNARMLVAVAQSLEQIIRGEDVIPEPAAPAADPDVGSEPGADPPGNGNGVD